jgi:hypothetical protein
MILGYVTIYKQFRQIYENTIPQNQQFVNSYFVILITNDVTIYNFFLFSPKQRGGFSKMTEFRAHKAV